MDPIVQIFLLISIVFIALALVSAIFIVVAIFRDDKRSMYVARGIMWLWTPIIVAWCVSLAAGGLTIPLGILILFLWAMLYEAVVERLDNLCGRQHKITWMWACATAPSMR